MKKCCKCEIEKDESEFSKNVTRKDGLKEACKPCMRAYKIQWRKDNHERYSKLHREGGRRRRLKTFGLTLEQFYLMHDNQKGKCKICDMEIAREPQSDGPGRNPAHIDHNHNTGKVRGLLCKNCNPGLGQFKDNIDLLEKAILYLSENGG